VDYTVARPPVGAWWILSAAWGLPERRGGRQGRVSGRTVLRRLVVGFQGTKEWLWRSSRSKSASRVFRFHRSYGLHSMGSQFYHRIGRRGSLFAGLVVIKSIVTTDKSEIYMRPALNVICRTAARAYFRLGAPPLRRRRNEYSPRLGRLTLLSPYLTTRHYFFLLWWARVRRASFTISPWPAFAGLMPRWRGGGGGVFLPPRSRRK